MKTLVETMENFVDDLCKKIDNLTAHSYTASFLILNLASI